MLVDERRSLARLVVEHRAALGHQLLETGDGFVDLILLELLRQLKNGA